MPAESTHEPIVLMSSSLNPNRRPFTWPTPIRRVVDLPEEVRDRAYHAQPPWKRMVVIAAGPLMNVLLAFVLLFSYFALIGPRDPTEASATVDVIEKGYPAERALEPGDRIVSVDGVSGAPAATAMASGRNASPAPVGASGGRVPAAACVVEGRPIGSFGVVRSAP